MWPTGLFQQKTEGIIVVLCHFWRNPIAWQHSDSTVPPQTRLVIMSRSVSFTPLVLQCCGWHALTGNLRHLYDFCSVWLKMGNTLLAKVFQFIWHHTRKRRAWGIQKRLTHKLQVIYENETHPWILHAEQFCRRMNTVTISSTVMHGCIRAPHPGLHHDDKVFRPPPSKLHSEYTLIAHINCYYGDKEEGGK